MPEGPVMSAPYAVRLWRCDPEDEQAVDAAVVLGTSPTGEGCLDGPVLDGAEFATASEAIACFLGEAWAQHCPQYRQAAWLELQGPGGHLKRTCGEAPEQHHHAVLPCRDHEALAAEEDRRRDAAADQDENPGRPRLGREESF